MTTNEKDSHKTNEVGYKNNILERLKEDGVSVSRSQPTYLDSR